MAEAGAGKSAQSRLELVDALRGYALMGLFLVHMEEYFELYWSNPSPHLTTTITFGLFMGKTFSLLALCFGFSFFIMMDRSARRGEPFAGRFAWRLILLLLIGFLHGLIYRGDIIVVLALSGFILIPFEQVRDNRILVAVAGLCFAQPYLLLWIFGGMAGASWAMGPPNFMNDPAMQTYLNGSFADALRANLGDGQANKWWFYIETGRCMQVFGLFLMGLVLGRIGFFAQPERFRTGRAVALVGFIASALIFSWLKSQAGEASEGPVFWVNTLIGGWFDLSCMAISVLLFVWLWQVGAQPLLRLLVPAGRMTLTLYVGQSLIFVPIFYPYGLGLYAHITQPQSLLLGISAFALQLLFAHMWFRSFHYGPLEWIWRAGTRRTLDVPFRRRAAAA